MPGLTSKYGEGVQRVPADTPIEDMTMLLKRDGGIIVEQLVSHKSIDISYQDIKPRMDRDKVWKGKFFPEQTKRCPGLIGVSKTFTQDQLMNPVYQAICDHFLTTRS
ncbi:hypothetical protein B0J14DRAFT_580335 [Halenospora varia]|nr:hypothetical protein B0J14DRAFT_580335 [Halenospora varia]